MSPSPAVYGLAPPQDLQDWLASNLHLSFRPLAPAELASVHISVAQVETSALDEPGSGYGPDHSFMTWTKIGCIYLGYYIGPGMPDLGYVPPRSVAYLVQQLGTPVQGWPGMNAQILVVNAVTGEKITRYSMGPGLVLGTTCGVTP